MTATDQSALVAVIDADGSSELRIGDGITEFDTASLEDARRAIMDRVVAEAVRRGTSVRVTVHEPDGVWPLLVHTDGTVETDEDVPSPGAGDDAPVSAAETPAPGASREPAAAPPAPTPVPAAAPAGPAVVPTGDAGAVGDGAPGQEGQEGPLMRRRQREGAAPAAAPPSPTSDAPQPPREGEPQAQPGRHGEERRRSEERRSFLTPERTEEPAQKGWRGMLARTGLRVPPSASERAERSDIYTVSQHWPGPRTIAVVNGKGGAGKTPTTILTAAVFARYGGAGVLAWDNNQTRGTLGWRTEQGPHNATLHDLLPETGRLLSTSAQSADLARYVHHQTRDRYDVLRSKPMLLAHEQRIESDDVDRIHAVAAKYYRLIIMDSGNDESDPMWRRMIDHTDQLVVATTTRAEHAEAGALLLEALAARDERSAQLAENSVAVVSQADPSAHPSTLRSVVDGYRALTRDVAAIPYDSAMAGGLLHYGALRPATRRAWLAAAAAIARGLGPQGT
ncbi:AAA family ATPase [Microbacterium album]|uniref:AAA domain-containing protein n=1 Tax=Microbacterium album TaxID=2053191 RepID=A0A917MP55_9MICO|nr:AAA family ATPase [Microbacterium album]GGH45349.1 hypothetical protein GCM10010921_20680 [Microbacterium album]